jgi:acetoin utilization protein AcuC
LSPDLKGVVALTEIDIMFSENMGKYDFGPGHPFRGDRFTNFIERFREELLSERSRFEIVEPRYATEEEILLVHDPLYIDYVKKTAARSGFLTLDTPLSPGMHEQAKLVVGAAIGGADRIMSGVASKAVVIGGGMHHAGVDYGGGFCIYNDVAIAAKLLLEKYRLERILILDTDAHAGNGTEDIFYEDPRVLFISLHQDPRTLYPGKGFIWEIGSGEGKGYTVCVPLPPGSGYDVYTLVMDEIFVPLAREFKPQIIFRNGGSDPHFADTLTNLGLSMKGFSMLGRYMREVSGELCGGKELDFIGSGYNPVVLPNAWVSIILGLAGIDRILPEPVKPPTWLDDPKLVEYTKSKIIEEIKTTLRDYWNCFR